MVKGYKLHLQYIADQSVVEHLLMVFLYCLRGIKVSSMGNLRFVPTGFV